MTAPPARPHMGFRPSSHFSIITAAQANSDWAEDDAWDSGSDDDKPLAPAPRKQPTTPSRANSLNIVPVAGSSKTSPTPSPLRPNPSLSANPTSNTNATAPTPIPFKQPSGPTSLNMIRAPSNLAPAPTRTPSAHPNLSIGSGTPNSNSNSSTAELSFSYTHVNAPSPSSYPAREGLNLGTGGAGITAGLGNRGVETGEAETGTEGEPGAAGDGIATDPTTDEEGRASIEVSSPKGRGWTFIKGKHKSRGRKKAAGEEQEHEKEGYRRWEMSATGSVDFGALVPDAPDSEDSDGEAMVVGDIDVDIEGKGEGTVRWKGRGEKDGKDRAKRESGGEVLEFVRARGSDDGTGVGKRGSASVTRETVEEEKEDVEVDKVGVEAIREDADAVVADPFSVLRRAHPYGHASGYNTKPSTPSRPSSTVSLSNVKSPERPSKERASSAQSNPNSGTGGLIRGRSVRTNRRHMQFVECLSREDINMTELKKLAWSGVPPHLRPIVWPLLLGYIPLPSSARLQALQRKREEFKTLVRIAFARGKEGLDQQIWHQIKIDVPRTRPGVKLWMEAGTHQSLERILYVWAIRHPASGYVQGINDLVTPFYQIFLSAYIDADPENYDPACLPPHILNAIEADSFWCLSRLLDGIQDNYISQQPGIHRSVKRMAELVKRIDAPLATHLESQSVEFMQFAFRWMNCLLMREISVKNTIRMWDTYLAEGTDSFSQFHLYVCSAFLVKWSEKLRGMEFQEIIMFLQSLPTQGWTDHEVELLLSEAFLLSSVWHNAQSHFGA